MGRAGINTPNVKLLFEKPFGVDLVSAQEVILRTAQYYNEAQIYRIDHYLAKEMAQNIIAFRGGNALFDHVWNGQSIEKIEVVALEEIGIEGRANFYEQTGALRDFLQGHLMQLLALVLMDIPANLDWDTLPGQRLAALKSVLSGDPYLAVRAQYEGYQHEVNNLGSLTETFVSLRLASKDPRWKDVPLILTTGKALSKKTTEVRVYFRKFHDAQSNCLVFRIQPDEGIEIDLFTKKPGYERKFERQKLNYRYEEDDVLPDAYEQVIVDAIASKKSLFTSGDEVLESWRILQPVLDSWEMADRPLFIYPKGSSTHTISSV
jgi:glucose-6-phosphate 1-dehydrogenase